MDRRRRLLNAALSIAREGPLQARCSGSTHPRKQEQTIRHPGRSADTRHARKAAAHTSEQSAIRKTSQTPKAFRGLPAEVILRIFNQTAWADLAILALTSRWALQRATEAMQLVTVLEVRHGALTDQALYRLATRMVLRHLITLWSPDCRIGDRGITALATGCPRLQTLHLRYTGEGGARAHHTHTGSWRITATRDITPDALIALSGHQLRHIALNRCPKLSDSALQRLAKNRTLEVVDVANAHLIGHRSMSALARCAGLRHIDVSFTRLDSASLRELRACSSLTALGASYTRLDGLTLAALSAALPALSVLAVAGTAVTSVSFASMLDRASFIDASECSYVDDYLAEMCKATGSSKIGQPLLLDLARTALTGHAAELLYKLEHVEKVCVVGCPDIPDAVKVKGTPAQEMPTFAMCAYGSCDHGYKCRVVG